MCGFVTLITTDASFSEKTIISMRDRLKHRGPDDAGYKILRTPCNSILAMGHRRLSILDLSTHGRQPMEDIEGRFIINFNGEIYNYIELKEILISKGYKFKTDTDTEVLIACYAEWAEDCVTKLNGMFAFSIWDKKKNILFLARDRFGEKPLYYSEIGDRGIAFSSEIKALFAHPEIMPEIETQIVNDFISKGQISYISEKTFFKNVFRLPPSYALLVNGQGSIVKKWKYWKPDYQQQEIKYTNERDLIEEFREKLDRSISMRLRSDVKIGACLSGGLDSSYLAGKIKTLQEQSKASLGYCYSARFNDDPTISEGNYIDSMIKHRDLSAIHVAPNPDDLMKESLKLHWHQEQPFLSASMYLEWCVLKKAKETGTTVIIDGQGADEVLAGYQNYFSSHQRDLLFNNNFFKLIQNTYLFNNRLKKEAKKYENSKRRINTEIALNFKKLGRAYIKNLKHKLYLAQNTIAPQIEGLQKNQRYSQLKAILERSTLIDMLPNNLHSADCNGMAHSVETRFPYIDYELYDWCLKLPNSMLINNGWQKYILRKAAEKVIPPNIQWRADKVGFAAPQDKWLRHELKEWAYEKLFFGPITEMENYNRPDLKKQWDNHQTEKNDSSWQLWSWISMNEWLTLHKNGTWKNGQI